MPPMRYSPYFTLPSGNVWVSPTSMPVCGSPSIAMSGTAGATGAEAPRIGRHDAPLVQGLAKTGSRRHRRRTGSRPGSVRVPRGAVGRQAVGRVAQPSRTGSRAVAADRDARPADGGDQRVRRREVDAAARVAGSSSPSSPEEKKMPMPSSAASDEGRRVGLQDVGRDVSEPPQELVMMSAPRCSTIVLSAAGRASSQLRAGDVEDVGAGRHGVDGLDVEGLLAVPALLAAQVAVDLVVEAELERALGQDLVELPRGEGPLAVASWRRCWRPAGWSAPRRRR